MLQLLTVSCVGMNILRPSIYFIDDDKALLDGLRRSLMSYRSRWEMSFFSDPLDALEAFEHFPVDMVVSDFQMREMNGVEVFGKMMENSGRTDTRFVLMSDAFDDYSASQQFYGLQIFSFLEKPLSCGELVQAIQDGLQDMQPTLSHNGQYAETALGMINAAVIVLSHEGKVLFSNSAGKALLSNNACFSIGADGICRASNSEDTRALREMTVQACEDLDNCVRWLTLKDSRENSALNLVAIPQGDHGAERTVVLLSTHAQGTSSLSVQVLQNMFGLTPAEAAITLAITLGDNLEEAARSSGITVSSARTYLKRVFGKTGASRQADLVKMILTSPAALVKKSA